eukprot:g71063.t1
MNFVATFSRVSSLKHIISSYIFHTLTTLRNVSKNAYRVTGFKRSKSSATKILQSRQVLWNSVFLLELDSIVLSCSLASIDRFADTAENKRASVIDRSEFVKLKARRESQSQSIPHVFATAQAGQNGNSESQDDLPKNQWASLSR